MVDGYQLTVSLYPQSYIKTTQGEKGLKKRFETSESFMLGLGHFNENRFRQNFQNCMNPLCFCRLEIEDASHHLLHYHHFSDHCIDLMNSINSVFLNFVSLSHNNKKDVLLYGDFCSDENKSKPFSEAVSLYKNFEKFSGSVFH